MTEHLRADEVAEWRPPWQRHEDDQEQRRRRTRRPAGHARGRARRRTDEYAQAVGVPSQHPAEAEERIGEEIPDAAPVPEDVDLGAVLEAILMIAEEPLTEEFLSAVLERPRSQVREQLGRLSAEYTGDGRGFDLRRQAGGWRFYTRADYARYVERFVTDGASARLTKAALETLAVVAYRQPVTRGRISAIRGVNCDGVMRTLRGARPGRGVRDRPGLDGDALPHHHPVLGEDRTGHGRTAARAGPVPARRRDGYRGR